MSAEEQETVSAHLPAAPLAALVNGAPRSNDRKAGPRNTSIERKYYRAVKQGALTVFAADELAIRLLGVHPMTIWGDQWLEAISAADSALAVVG